MLFLNRRGFSPVLYCGRCTSAVRCEACSVSLTLHLSRGRLVCHYCKAEMRRPEICPHCRMTPLTELGFGTEKVEGEVKRRFPSAVVVRMDTDTMKKREDYERVLGAFREKKIDVLVGTQMIAKGLDFPGVTVVGVVSADTGLFQPDFRAAERTFQLLSQVAGRAGRGHREGTVVIQTLCPENDAIRFAARGDFEGFLTKELASRRQAGYPPFTRLIRIILEGADLARVTERATKIRDELSGPAGSAGFTVLGPAPAPIAKIKGRHRWHLLVKCPDPKSFESAREALRDAEATGDARLRVLLDVDPASML
jgi:primosomal protein N' (replication factor Y)